MHKFFFKYIAIVLLLVGCSATAPSVNESDVERLAKLLTTLDTCIDTKKAKQLSKDIFLKTKALAQEFELTSPPQFHNFLITIGLREKGLCYHWSDALYAYLSQQQYSSFEFHLVGANIGSYWREHNAVVITVEGMDISEGILIDPWRNSGKLYFSKVKDDKQYKWYHRPNRGCKGHI